LGLRPLSESSNGSASECGQIQISNGLRYTAGSAMVYNGNPNPNPNPKSGKVVSRKRSEAGKKLGKKNGILKFAAAVKSARKALGIKGFQAIGGKSAKGQALLKKARSIYRK